MMINYGENDHLWIIGAKTRVLSPVDDHFGRKT
jgi:hypothetical protein